MKYFPSDDKPSEDKRWQARLQRLTDTLGWGEEILFVLFPLITSSHMCNHGLGGRSHGRRFRQRPGTFYAWSAAVGPSCGGGLGRPPVGLGDSCHTVIGLPAPCVSALWVDQNKLPRDDLSPSPSLQPFPPTPHPLLRMSLSLSLRLIRLRSLFLLLHPSHQLWYMLDFLQAELHFKEKSERRFTSLDGVCVFSLNALDAKHYFNTLHTHASAEISW